MNKKTREFVKIAYLAMQSAYYNEVEANGNNFDAEWVKVVGDVLQEVGDLSRKL